MKKKGGNTIVVSTLDELEQINGLAIQLGVKLVLSENGETVLRDQDTVAYYNPGGNDEDKRLRSVATINRVITFSEKESLGAFILALSIKDFSVNSIDEWHNMIKEDVSTL